MFEVTSLSTTHIHLHNVFCAVLVATGVALGTASPTEAQTAATAAVSDAMLTLPDAPDAASSSASNQLSRMQATAAPSTSTQIAPNSPFNSLHRIVPPGAQPPPLTVGDKILYGLRNSVTHFSAAGWVFSAGYSHLLNNSPNYGTNSKAFAQRLGATTARSVSDGIFSSSIMAPILHEDPRYYVMGRGHPILKRTFYAVTRTLITRTDSGQTTPNFALISGNFAGAALTNAYYPPMNRGFSETAKTFGMSLSGSAFGFIVNEFYTDALEMVHLKKNQ